MGHGGQANGEAVLVMEREDGGAALLSARDLLAMAHDTLALATLNACVSATPGPTTFANLAAALAHEGAPYALGMRFSVIDEDARALSRTLYGELARGVSIEEAVRQARIALERGPRAWAVGVPVLYTSLSEPGAGFRGGATGPSVIDPQPRLELFALPRAEGAFHGRESELRQLGGLLTGSEAPPVLVIQGPAGQGKTALAREAAERFAWAWPGGAWAVVLDPPPPVASVAAELAAFLSLSVEASADPEATIAHIQAKLAEQRVLIVLDGAEGLLRALDRGDANAARLRRLFAEELVAAGAGVLVTSQDVPGWPSERLLPLDGLKPDDGRRLFRDSAPRRQRKANDPLAAQLSALVGGHPLSLRLLGRAFDGDDGGLADLVAGYRERLALAEDGPVGARARERSLMASLAVSIAALDPAALWLLSRLPLFRGPFPADLGGRLFAQTDDEAGQAVAEQALLTLWRRGLLARLTIPGTACVRRAAVPCAA
jgi:hypothetical protein